MNRAETPSRRETGFRLRRPAVSVESIIIAAALFFVLACNRGFLGLFFGGRDFGLPYTWALVLAGTAILVLVHVFALSLILNRWTAKPLLTLLIAASPAPVYFMSRYGVIYDSGMMRNFVHTDPKEVWELLTPGLLRDFVLLGAVPIALLWWVRIEGRTMGRALRMRAAMMAATIGLIAAFGLPFTKDLFATARNHKQLDHMLVPTSVIVATAKVLSADKRVKEKSIDIGLDARAAMPEAEHRKPRLLVLVVGETARANNWGLSGYARQTTPELAAMKDVINFTDVTSCGTATEVSVPCMFSPYGRRHFDEDAIRAHKGLLHVLDHAGLSVLWRDNQSGCKGVCDDLPTDQLTNATDRRWCSDHRCFDDILLEGLDQRIDAAKGDMVVVLHQLGNHGPTYFERYTEAYRRFNPTCDTAELGNCPVEAVVNTYDNALLYTDHFLADTIRLLQRRTDRDTAMLYLSDHGESLGEYGLFLHGMPYKIAPSEQTHVPMVMWFSEGMAKGLGLDTRCLAKDVAAEPTSHDALFSTVLGLMQVSTSLYEPAMDLTTPCRATPGIAADRQLPHHAG